MSETIDLYLIVYSFLSVQDCLLDPVGKVQELELWVLPRETWSQSFRAEYDCGPELFFKGMSSCKPQNWTLL